MTTKNDLLVEGSDKVGGPRYPKLNTLRGTHHLTVRKAFVKHSEQGPEVYAIGELEDGDGTVFSIIERIDNGQKFPEYARNRWRQFLEAAMGESPATPAEYSALIERAQTDQGGEIAGKAVTAIVRPGKNPKYNDIDWVTGHQGAADSPPPAPSQEEKAAALGYIQNGDSEYWYHPKTRDQKKLSEF